MLVAASWTVQRGAAERAALAESYRSLSAYASGLAAGSTEPPPPADFSATAVVADPNPLLSDTTRAICLNLLEQAERIRASLAALGAHTAADPSGTVRTFAVRTSEVLDVAAEAMSGRSAVPATRLRELNAALAGQAAAARTSGWHWVAEALLGQLRAVDTIVGRMRTTGSGTGHAGPTRRRSGPSPGRGGVDGPDAQGQSDPGGGDRASCGAAGRRRRAGRADGARQWPVPGPLGGC
ncbi:hypothetical protein E4K10_34990 [Streptomyces sp. T1317-0309]|nr:hypothetical protein E4K10_34990 [Streptomyces sp. T1317-0309]